MKEHKKKMEGFEQLDAAHGLFAGCWFVLLVLAGLEGLRA